MKKLVLNRVYKIVGYQKGLDEKTKTRLCEFGFVPDTTFCVIFKSLLGKNVIVEIRGFVLSLKKEYLSCLEVV